MLHEKASMADIDVDHWRNLQDLLLDSAKERRRIVLIHERGEVLKIAHSHHLPVRGKVGQVDNPHALAESLYRENVGSIDFVAVFERSAFDEYFARWQATWRWDEDLDEFVHRAYEMMDEYPDGLVTYPTGARHTLGLQWRLGATHEQVKAAVARYVPPRSSVVFGVFDDSSLWATLVLGFDSERRVNVVTTVDPSELDLARDRRELADMVVSWVNARFAPCSVALFASLVGAKTFLAAEDKLGALRQLIAVGDLIASQLPPGLQLGPTSAPVSSDKYP